MIHQPVAAPAFLELPRLSQVIRHRLRNFSGGAGMALHYLESCCSKEDALAGDFLAAMQGSVEELCRFSERLDLLVDVLPAPQPEYLGTCLDQLRLRQERQWPYAHLAIHGDMPELTVRCGSWLVIVLQELVSNAFEAQPRDGSLQIEITAIEPLCISLMNPPGDAVGLPPLQAGPFTHARGGHDGMGLALAKRLCHAVAGDLATDWTDTRHICVTLRWPELPKGERSCPDPRLC